MGEFLRKGVAAAAVMAVLATGCGGGGVTRVGGTVSGLAGGTAVTLQLNGGETLVLGGNGGFRFDEQLGAGESFSVTIVGQPARATCTVANAAGEIDRNASSVDNVTVVCTQRHAVMLVVEHQAELAIEPRG